MGSGLREGGGGGAADADGDANPACGGPAGASGAAASRAGTTVGGWAGGETGPNDLGEGDSLAAPNWLVKDEEAYRGGGSTAEAGVAGPAKPCDDVCAVAAGGTEATAAVAEKDDPPETCGSAIAEPGAGPFTPPAGPAKASGGKGPFPEGDVAAAADMVPAAGPAADGVEPATGPLPAGQP